MLSEHLFYNPFVDQSVTRTTRPKADVAKHSLQPSAKPLVQRDSEAVLRFVQYFRRNDPLQRPFQEVLRRPAADLEPPRKAERVLNKMMIKEWHPCFQADRHRCLVGFFQICVW